MSSFIFFDFYMHCNLLLILILRLSARVRMHVRHAIVYVCCAICFIVLQYLMHYNLLLILFLRLSARMLMHACVHVRHATVCAIYFIVWHTCYCLLYACCAICFIILQYQWIMSGVWEDGDVLYW